MRHTAEDLGRLREITGSGLDDCRYALERAHSFEDALNYLKVKDCFFGWGYRFARAFEKREPTDGGQE